MSNEVRGSAEALGRQGSHGGRNSSFELLRLIAMFMIVAHHHVTHNPFPAFDQPASINQFAYVFFLSMGKISVDIFFGISAWFLCESRDLSIRKSLRRIWILERQMLFYSLTLMVCFLVFDRKDIMSEQIIGSFFPTLYDMWWYPTNYVLFLLFYPFVTVGLQKMGQRMHACLAVALLLVWGLAYGMTPNDYAGFLSATFVSFIYQYVLIAYYRWYMRKASRALSWSMAGVGALMILAIMVIADLVHLRHGGPFPRIVFDYLIAEGKLPQLLIAFGCLLIADRMYIKSRLINYLARGTFGVYLIHDYPPVRKVLWSFFDIGKIWGGHGAAVYSLAIVVLVFTVCLVLDLIREFLFSHTIDRRRGYWFDLLADWFQSSPAIVRVRQYLTGLQKVNTD